MVLVSSEATGRLRLIEGWVGSVVGCAVLFVKDWLPMRRAEGVVCARCIECMCGACAGALWI